MRKNRILNVNDLISHGNIEGRTAILKILEAGLEAADPYKNTKRLIHLENGKLIVGHEHFEPKGAPVTKKEVYNLSKVENIFVIGAGKGCQRVAKALEESLKDRLTDGHVIDKKGNDVILKKIKVTLGGHPLPDKDCVRGSERILEIVENVGKKSLIFTITTNGVSSLLTLPAPEVSLEDIREITYKMQIEKGAPTSDLNPIRNHLDMMKGGRISNYIHPSKMIHIVADDPGEYNYLMNKNFWIATLPDSSTFKDAIFLLKKWKIWHAVSSAVREYLINAPLERETIKIKEFKEMSFQIFGVMPKEEGMIPTACEKARKLGFNPIVIAKNLQAEASQAGLIIATIAKTIEQTNKPFAQPCALFTSGELLVTVGKEKGVGGRNQEFVLSAALKVIDSKKIVMGAVDSDGTDGPGTTLLKGTRAFPCLAGGVIDGKTVNEARKVDVNILKALKRHNTTPTLLKLKSGIITTNSISLDDISVTLIGMPQTNEED